MKHLFTKVLLAIITCVVLTSIAQAQTLPTVLPLMNKAPQIDGKIGVDEWKQAHALGKLQMANPESTFPVTQAWIGYDASFLYVAVQCAEPFPKKIKTTVIPDEKDGAVAYDDCVHLFLDLGNRGQSIFQLISNSAGTIYDARIMNGNISASAWDSNAVVRTSIGAVSWEVEMAIPLQSLGHQPTRGEVLSLNVSRTRYVDAVPQVASLAKGQLINTSLFAPLLVGGALETGGTSLISTERGPFYRGAPGVWKFEVNQSATSKSTLTAQFPQANISRTYDLKPGPQTISVDIPADQVQAFSQIALSVNGQTLYRSSYDMVQAALPERVAVTQNPLYKTLLVDNPKGLSKDGIILWAHDIAGPPHPSLLAHRNGTVYNPELVLKELARDRAILVTSRAALTPAVLAEYKKNGIKSVILLDTRAGIPEGAPAPGDGRWPWWQDPHAIDVFLKDAEESIKLAKDNPGIWGIMAGDESWEDNDHILKWFLDNQRHGYPALEAADAEIKAKYGFGKYGLPESSTDPNPFRWIATRRWEVDQMLDLAGKVRAMIDKEAPQLKFVSWDNRSSHQPYELRRWNHYFDVMTGQLYPARDKNRQSMGFITKLLGDLSRTNELWPVAHVEHYPANFTPDETAELLSQTFRSGANGLHIFPSDTIGRRAGKGAFATDRIGAPERWQVLESAFDRLDKPFKVKQPISDTAILYSDASYQGQVSSTKTNEPEWIYTLLGPQLKSALTFIDGQGKSDELVRYKTLYIPYAPIIDDKEYDALKNYVEQGGTLIINDPLAFRHRSDGTARTIGALLPPLQSTEAVPLESLKTANGNTLKPTGARYLFQKDAGKTVIADSQNQPVVIETTLGQGKVLFFGMNPLVPAVIKDAGWTEVFRGIQRDAGASMDNDVWRFRFPTPPKYQAARPAGTCLTNNYFEWHLSEAQPVANVALDGSYHLSVAAAEPADQDISFSEGRLTDRRKGAAAPNNAPGQNYELTWKAEKPLDITYQFGTPVQAQQIRLFYAYTLPAGWCEVSADGTNWQKVGEWKSASAGAPANVALQSIDWKSRAATHLRLHFEAAPGEIFTLVETDIWGSVG